MMLHFRLHLSPKNSCKLFTRYTCQDTDMHRNILCKFYVRLGISNTQDLLAIIFFLLPCPYTIYRQMLHFHVCNREKLSLHSCWVCLLCPAQPYSTAIPPTDMGTGRQCSALCLLLKGPVCAADQCLRSLKTEGNTFEISLLSPVWPDQLWHTGHLLLITRYSLGWGTVWLFILCTAQTKVMRGVLKPFWSRPFYIAKLHIRWSSKQASFHTTWLSKFFFCLKTSIYCSNMDE